MESMFRNDPERLSNEVANNIDELSTIKNTPYNKVTRQYFLADMNQKAVDVRMHVMKGTSEIYLNQILRNSELSP